MTVTPKFSAFIRAGLLVGAVGLASFAATAQENPVKRVPDDAWVNAKVRVLGVTPKTDWSDAPRLLRQAMGRDVGTRKFSSSDTVLAWKGTCAFPVSALSKVFDIFTVEKDEEVNPFAGGRHCAKATYVKTGKSGWFGTERELKRLVSIQTADGVMREEAKVALFAKFGAPAAQAGAYRRYDDQTEGFVTVYGFGPQIAPWDERAVYNLPTSLNARMGVYALEAEIEVAGETTIVRLTYTNPTDLPATPGDTGEGGGDDGPFKF